jgi:hypothetical protein
MAIRTTPVTIFTVILAAVPVGSPVAWNADYGKHERLASLCAAMEIVASLRSSQ